MKRSSFIKRTTEQIKALRNLERVPNQPARPASDAKRQEAHDAKWNNHPSKQAIRFWSEAFTYDDSRRSGRAPGGSA